MSITNLSVFVSEPEIDPMIARDSEVTAAINAHITGDPHPQYLLSSEADVRYRLASVIISDAELPSTIARDSEVTAAIAAHKNETDPHPTYLTQGEGDGRYRLNSTALTDSDIPAAIARDAEVTASMNAHLAALDPHTQYPTQAEADARYFRGRSQLHTLDPPSLAANELYKIFFTFVGAKVGDAALVVPINVNMFTFALWPFILTACVESADTVGVYLRNDHIAAIDLGSFQIRILVINF